MDLEKIVRAYISAYNEKDVEGMGSYFLEHCIFQNLSSSLEFIYVEGLSNLRDLA